jgi:hypothetical protein
MDYDFSYFKNLVNKQYQETFNNINKRLNEIYKGKDQKWKEIIVKTQQFIKWCLDEYQKDGEIVLYCFTNEVFWSENPIMFLKGLHSFVGNCIYDDSYFVVEYRDYPDEWYNCKNIREKIENYKSNYIRQVNGVFDYNKLKHLYWQPVLLWVGDNKDATQNPDYLLSAIKFIEDQRNHRNHRILIAQERKNK